MEFISFKYNMRINFQVTCRPSFYCPRNFLASFSHIPSWSPKMKNTPPTPLYSGNQFWTSSNYFVISACTKAISSTTAACNWFSITEGAVQAVQGNLHNYRYRPIYQVLKMSGTCLIKILENKFESSNRAAYPFGM